MKVPIEEIKRVFFAAMLQGYAANGPKEEGPEGSKQYRYVEGDWEVIDRYWVNRGENYSWGYTQITFKGEPVWWMSYGGDYDKDAIPFLKKALLENYRQAIFRGGRGPQSFSNTSLEYRNCVTASGFDRFCGYENVTGHVGGSYAGGFHQYQGGLLFRSD